MNETLVKKLLEEVQRNRTEIKNAIEASEARLLLRIEEQSNRIRQLEVENQILNEKVENLERNSRNNNLIIYGLNKCPSDITSEFICNQIKILVGIDLQESDINNFYTLGKTETAPVKLELISFIKKKSILKNCNKLKGKNISIGNDLTTTQRKEYKILKYYLTHELKNKNYKTCYIKGNKLILDDLVYTAEELSHLDTDIAIGKKGESAPSTPTYVNKETNFIRRAADQEHLVNQNINQESTPKSSLPGTKSEKQPENPIRKNLRSTTSNKNSWGLI